MAVQFSAAARKSGISLSTLRSLYNHFEHNRSLSPKAIVELTSLARKGNRHVQFVPAGTKVYRGGIRQARKKIGKAGTSWTRSRRVAEGYSGVEGSGYERVAQAVLPARAAIAGKRLATLVGAHRQVRDQEVIGLRPLSVTVTANPGYWPETTGDDVLDDVLFDMTGATDPRPPGTRKFVPAPIKSPTRRYREREQREREKREPSVQGFLARFGLGRK
jgi:hypothetical protein